MVSLVFLNFIFFKDNALTEEEAFYKTKEAINSLT